MGLIYATIILRNPKEDTFKEMTLNALVDSGSLHLCIPERVAIQLDLKELYKREVTTADGKEHLCPYVGPVEVKFENRGCFTGAIVLGDEILLGAVPMEDMDVLISPAQRALVVNPKSPNIPSSIAKRLEWFET
ncbi:MAG: clan AA aspartic protease [bacterium]